LMPRGAK